MPFLCRAVSQETDYEDECVFTAPAFRDATNALATFQQNHKARGFDLEYLDFSVEEVDESYVTWMLLKETA